MFCLRLRFAGLKRLLFMLITFCWYYQIVAFIFMLTVKVFSTNTLIYGKRETLHHVQ